MNRPPSKRPRRGPNRDYYSSNSRAGESYMQRNKRLPSSSEDKINFNTGTVAVLAGVLILGVGIICTPKMH